MVPAGTRLRPSMHCLWLVLHVPVHMVCVFIRILLDYGILRSNAYQIVSSQVSCDLLTQALY